MTKALPPPTESQVEYLMDLARRVAVDYLDHGGEPSRAAELLKAMADRTGRDLTTDDLALAADHQEQKPVGIQIADDQDKDAESGGA